MTDKTYNTLKWLASPGLPAIAVFLGTAAEIWNFPVLSLVGLTVAAVGACFGKWTGDESKKYFSDKDIVPKCDDACEIKETE